MPIRIPDKLPASKTLRKENIFLMPEKKAATQDIRPLKIILLNLMPTKIATETQLLRLIGNSPLQVEISLMKTESYQSKNTPEEHLLNFYNGFDYYKNQKFDGMIITGAPVENMPFESVEYWGELCRVMEWSKTNVTSTMHICWGAQAAMFYHYDIEKVALSNKMFGIFEHKICKSGHKLMRGFDDAFFAPHSRHTEIIRSEIEECEDLEILSESKDAGIYIVASGTGKQIFVTGHAEYDKETLAAEYFRDVDKGLDISVPKNYFPKDDVRRSPVVSWRGHAHLLFSNWLNYFVYQETPYNIEKIH